VPSEWGKLATETLPPLPISEDVMERFIVQADQPSLRIEVRFDGVPLAVLRQKVGQRLFAEAREVPPQEGGHPLSARPAPRPDRGQRTDHLPGADVQTTQAYLQHLPLVRDGLVERGWGIPRSHSTSKGGPATSIP
jgi:hypothetical protein